MCIQGPAVPTCMCLTLVSCILAPHSRLRVLKNIVGAKHGKSELFGGLERQERLFHMCAYRGRDKNGREIATDLVEMHMEFGIQ